MVGTLRIAHLQLTTINSCHSELVSVSIYHCLYDSLLLRCRNKFGMTLLVKIKYFLLIPSCVFSGGRRVNEVTLSIWISLCLLLTEKAKFLSEQSELRNLDEGKNRQIICFKISSLVVLPHLVVLTFEQGSNVRTTFLSWQQERKIIQIFFFSVPLK
jgi:hypothetical protein